MVLTVFLSTASILASKYCSIVFLEFFNPLSSQRMFQHLFNNTVRNSCQIRSGFSTFDNMTGVSDTGWDDEAYAAGKELPNILGNTFYDAFSGIGGAGGTLSLCCLMPAINICISHLFVHSWKIFFLIFISRTCWWFIISNWYFKCSLF